jgi:hypothetical protein
LIRKESAVMIRFGWVKFESTGFVVRLWWRSTIPACLASWVCLFVFGSQAAFGAGYGEALATDATGSSEALDSDAVATGEAFATDSAEMGETVVTDMAASDIRPAACVCCPRCGRYHYQSRGCPDAAGRMAPQTPSTSPNSTMPGATGQPNMPQPNARPATPGMPGAAANQPTSNNLASSLGAASAPQSAAPFMIGDQLGTGTGTSTLVGPPIDQAIPIGLNNVHSSNAPFVFVGHNGNYGIAGGLSPSGAASYSGLSQGTLNATSIPVVFTPTTGPNFSAFNTGTLYYNGLLPGPAPLYNIDPVYRISVPTPGVTTIGAIKIAENSSPMPRDRIFFNYSLFDNVQLPPNAFNINRFTPGFEKTFFDRRASIEMRMPFATTLNTGDMITDGSTSTSKLQFGNLSVTFKGLVYATQSVAMSVGLQLQAPTAGSTRVYTADGTPLVDIKNSSTHLMPFVGGLYTPNDRFYAQGFLQVDVDANGDPVLVNSFDPANDLTKIGTTRQATFLYADVGLGYWIMRNNYAKWLTGVAPTIEVHHNQSLSSTQAVSAGVFQIGSYASNIGNTNLVVGTNFQIGPLSSLSTAYCVPVEGGTDKQFAGEFRVLFNRRFGTQSRLTRAQF